MKKNVIKTAVAAVCVVAAGMGGLKAYNVANQSEADMLLAENVEALGLGDPGDLLSMKDVSRYVQISRGSQVTAITGNTAAAIKLSISIGKLLQPGELEVALRAGVQLELKPCKTYKESCFSKKGSNCACIETGWIPCEDDNHCPKSCS